MGTQFPHGKGHNSPSPLFGPCLLWRNGRLSQLLLSSFCSFTRFLIALKGIIDAIFIQRCIYSTPQTILRPCTLRHFAAFAVFARRCSSLHVPPRPIIRPKLSLCRRLRDVRLTCLYCNCALPTSLRFTRDLCRAWPSAFHSYCQYAKPTDLFLMAVL